LVGFLGSLTPAFLPHNLQFLAFLLGRGGAGERRGGSMGSFAKLARRAVETDAPVMVKVMNFSCLVEIAFDSEFLGLLC
jgi:hypothetical protein